MYQVHVTVYNKVGTFSGYEFSHFSWTKLGSGYVLGAGTGRPTSLPSGFFRPIEIFAGQFQAFYIVLDVPNLWYSNGNQNSGLYSQNNDLRIYQGAGMGAQKFGYPKFSPRVWNGIVHYLLPGDEQQPVSPAMGSSIEKFNSDKELFTTMAGEFLENSLSTVNLIGFALFLKTPRVRQWEAIFFAVTPFNCFAFSGKAFSIFGITKCI